MRAFLRRAVDAEAARIEREVRRQLGARPVRGEPLRVVAERVDRPRQLPAGGAPTP